MGVVADIIEGADLREGQDGYECSRKFVVQGLSGNASARLYEALTTSGVPRRGEPHPTIPGLVAADRSATSIQRTTNAVQVTITYRPLNGTELDGAAPVVEVRAALSNERVHRDAYGKLLYKTRTETVHDAEGKPVAAFTLFALAEFDVDRPQVVLLFRRKTSRNPAAYAMKFVGKVGDWGRADPITSPWKVTRIDGTTQDGGTSYDEQIEMVYKRDGWAGRVPRVVSGVTGLGGAPGLDERDYLVPLYEAVSFDPLGLPKPDVEPVVDVYGDLAPNPMPLERT